MKNTKSKLLSVLFVLCSVLILFASCQKKAETSQTTSAKVEESAAVKTETKTSAPEAKAEEPAQVAKTEETAAAAKAEEPAVVSQSVVETKSEEKAEETPEEKKEETAAPSAEAVEEPVYTDTLTYKGFNTTVVVDNTMSSISLPGGVGLEEVEAVAGLINRAYPEEAALVSYALDGDTLLLTYPEQSDSFLLSVVEALRSEAMALLDSYVVKSVKETTVTVADVTAVKAQEETSSESSAVYADTLSYRGLTTSVAVYNDNAMVRVPEGVSFDDVLYVADMVRAAYPAESSLVYYDYKDGVLSLTYPEQTDEFLLQVIDVLRSEAMALIDKAAPAELPAGKTETVKAEEKAPEEAEKAVVITETAKAEEKGVLFTVTFSYNGYNSDITVTNTRATLTIPEGISEEDIAAVAKNVADRYPSESSLITYSLENGKLILLYPYQSSDYLRACMIYVEKEAKALLDLYPITNEVISTEVSVTYPSAVVPVSDSSEETAKTVTGALSSPSAVLEKKKGGVFSYDITLSLKGKFVFYKGSDHIYPTLSFSMRDTFEESFYLEAGVDVFTYINSDKLFAVAGMNLNAGFNVPINNFDFYFYTGLRYQLASKSASFKSGLSVTVGTGIDWRINDHLITGVGYEYYGSASLFSFFLKYRF